MIVKNFQFETFSNLNKNLFIKRIIALLRTEFESASEIPDDEFKVAITNQIEMANQYGIQIQSNIAKYIITAFLMGEEFDKNFEGARKILENNSFDENEKIASLEEWTLQVFEVLESKQ